MMDAKFHRVPNTIGEIQEVLLLIRIMGMDEHRCSVHSLLDPQQLCLQLCSMHERNEHEE
jgi:hypothetical protein